MQTKLHKILEKTIPGLGYELVDVTVSPAKLITVFIDTPSGINIDDCEKVSNHLIKLFAVEEIDFSRLEISSPGLERPLKTLADFAKHKTKLAKIKTHTAVNGLKVFHGNIGDVSETTVTLHLVDEKTVTLKKQDISLQHNHLQTDAAPKIRSKTRVSGTLAIELSNINRARLVFDKFVKGK